MASTSQEIVDGYHNQVRLDVVASIPRKPNGVLVDVGGGTGATAAYMKSVGLAGKVGVIDRVAEEDSHPDVDFHHSGEIEDPDFVAKVIAQDGPFDTILTLDILEHLVDPWALVAQLHQALAPGGHIVASIPNVRHYRVSGRLFFRNEYGAGKLNFPILGAEYPVDSFDTLILKGGHNYAWANAGGTPVERSDYMRDEFARRTQEAITGTAVDSSGKPMAGAFVMLREDVRQGDGGMMMMFGAGGNRVREDGTFVLPNVTPGDYVLEAREMGMGMGPGRRGGSDDAIRLPDGCRHRRRPGRRRIAGRAHRVR